MEILEKINKQLDEFKEKRKTLVEELRNGFPALIVPLLSESKRIESVGWRQYTPYFNDGDECVFGVRNDDLDINGFVYGDDDSLLFLRETTWESGESRPNPTADQFEIDILDKIQKVLQGVPQEFYKDLFGDHIRVTIYKDGRIETEEYDHD